MTNTQIQNHQIPSTPPAAEPRWAPHRVILLSLAAFLLLGSASSLAGAAWLEGVDDDRREGDYLTFDARHLESEGHALAVEEIDLDGLSGDEVLGEARLRATSTDADASLFVGIALTSDVDDYLREVQHSTVDDVDDPQAEYDEHAGGVPSADPADLDIWAAQSSGPGTQSVTWTPEDGRWTAVIMNTDGASGVDVKADVGATVPVLDTVVRVAWITGSVLGLMALVLLAVGLGRPKRH